MRGKSLAQEDRDKANIGCSPTVGISEHLVWQAGGPLSTTVAAQNAKGNPMYTKQMEIYNRNGWRLVSFGNGAAYALHDDQDHKSVFFQGDDAECFRGNCMDNEGWLIDNCEERFGDYSEVMSMEQGK